MTRARVVVPSAPVVRDSLEIMTADEIAEMSRVDRKTIDEAVQRRGLRA